MQFFRHKLNFWEGTSRMSDTAFERAIESARKSNSDRVLSNSSISHASFVMKQLFEFAADNSMPIRICSGALNKKCFDDVLSATAEGLLEKGIPIEVIVTDLPANEVAENTFANTLLKSESPQARLWALNKEEIGDNYSHFAVVGDRAFRFEVDHSLAKAFVSFNQPNIGEEILEEFETLKSSSASIH
jgi:hypothetical protein